MKLRIPRYPITVVLRRGALAYLIVWVLSPPLAYGDIWRILAVFAMGLWLALELRSKRSVLLQPNWPVLGCVLFVFYTLAIEFLAPDETDINQHFQIWIMFFFLLVGESQQRGRSDEARFCFWTILLVLPIWMATTLRGIETISVDVARTISRSSDVARELTAQGIGGYSLIYTVVLCVPFLIQLALRFRSGLDESAQPRWKQRCKRLLISGNSLLALWLVLRAGYSIAATMLMLTIPCVLLIHSRRAMPFAISLCLVCLLAFLGSIALEPALRSLEGLVAGTEYSAKVRDVLASLNEGQSTGTLEMRTERYLRSVHMFFENPLMGTLVLTGNGGHSAILDRFGQYGVAIGALFLALLIFIPLRFLRSPQVPVGLGMAFLIVAVMVPTLNTVFMSWGLILYVFSRGAFAVIGVPLEKVRSKPRAEASWGHDATASGLFR